MASSRHAQCSPRVGTQQQYDQLPRLPRPSRPQTKNLEFIDYIHILRLFINEGELAIGLYLIDTNVIEHFSDKQPAAVEMYRHVV